MKATAPLVSIGIPTFNRAALIARAIDSALNQDYPNVEVLVSDNASTDGTAEVCRAYAQQHPRVRYLQQPVNRGATQNFNAVLQHARGEFFMWLGDDDYVDVHYVGTAVAALQQDARIGLFSGTVHYYREGVHAFAGQRFSVLAASGWRRLAAYYWQVTDNGVFYGLMRSSVARRIELPNVLGGDWLFVARIAAAGSIVMCGDVCVHRELGGASASHSATTKSLGLSRLNAAFPKLTLAWNAFRDVASGGYPLNDRAIFVRPFAVFVLGLMLLKAMRQNLAYSAMRCHNLLKRLGPTYHTRTRS